jgi:hypothetical protein
MQRSLLIVLAALASPAAAAAQTAEPARAPRFLVAGSVSSDFGGADVRSAGEYCTVGAQATWLPVSWLGLTGDVYEVILPRFFPYGLGFGARLGPTLRWPFGLGPVSPYVTAQIGWDGVLIAGAGTAAFLEKRAEAGVDIPLGKFLAQANRPGVRMFLSVGGGVVEATPSYSALNERFHFARLSFGAAL